jgi:hypothetical protein
MHDRSRLRQNESLAVGARTRDERSDENDDRQIPGSTAAMAHSNTAPQTGTQNGPVAILVSPVREFFVDRLWEWGCERDWG